MRLLCFDQKGEMKHVGGGVRRRPFTLLYGCWRISPGVPLSLISSHISRSETGRPMHIVRSVNREGINRSENRRAFFQRFRNPVGLLTQKLRFFDEALFTRIIKTSWYLTPWLEFTNEPDISRCCGHRVALFEGCRGRAGAHALRIPGLTAPGYMMSPSLRALVAEPGLAPRESWRIPGLTPPGYVMPPSSRVLVAEPGLAWCESRPNPGAHATGLSSVEFGRIKVTRFIKISAERPRGDVCATSAPPHNSIRSSELLRF